MIAWSAVRTLARHEWRTRWQALVLLGVASGIVAGTALAIATVLWRTDTAYDRLVSATNLDDVRVSIITTSGIPSERPPILAEQRRTTAALLLVLLLAAMLLIAQNTRLLLRRRGSQLAVVDAMGMPRRELIGAAARSVRVSG